jgi:hypothetical protein
MQITTWDKGLSEIKNRRARERARVEADRKFANLCELAKASEQIGAVLDRLESWINRV